MNSSSADFIVMVNICAVPISNQGMSHNFTPDVLNFGDVKYKSGDRSYKGNELCEALKDTVDKCQLAPKVEKITEINILIMPFFFLCSAFVS